MRVCVVRGYLEEGNARTDVLRQEMLECLRNSEEAGDKEQQKEEAEEGC